MRHKFPYDEFDSIDIPDQNVSGIYSLLDSMNSRDDVEIIKAALNSPIGCGRLSSEVKPGMRILIAVDDSSRSTRTDLMLPLVLEELGTAGIPKEDIRILIALGTHRKMTRKEMEEKYTPDVVAKYHFINPDWKDRNSYKSIGQSSTGFDIRIHHSILDADYVIGVGQTIPHMIAGYGGGCKIINPGCADGNTVAEIHWLSNTVPDGRLFAIRDNAVRNIIDEIGIKAGLRFIINDVPSIDTRIAGAFAGDPILAHRQACDFAKNICLVPVKEETDIVLADSYPADIDFWQALKALNAACGAVKKDGTVILVTPCPEGTSSQHHELTTYGYMPRDEIRSMVAAGQLDKCVGGNMYLGRGLLDKANVILVSLGISQADALAMRFQWAPDATAALEQAMAVHGASATINILYKSAKMICVPERD
jgi:nickel-dependent lactate racemase